MIGQHKGEQAVTVRALRGAAPYIHMYKGKVFVIKTGGGAFRDPVTMRAFVEQVAILHHLGIRVVLVEPAFTRTAFEENLAKPDRLLDVYETVRAEIEVVMRQGIEGGDAPEVVAAAVVKAATDRVPRTRYTAGKMARQVSLLRRFVPASAFDRSLRKQNGLPAWAP